MALTASLFVGFPAVATAQQNDEVKDVENIIVTGTRVANRSVADAPVPVDIISGEDFRDSSATECTGFIAYCCSIFRH